MYGKRIAAAGGVACAAIGALLAVEPGCTHDRSPDKGANVNGQAAAPIAASGAVLFKIQGRTIQVRVEVVRTPAARARGLMYRRELAADAGMLFVFDSQEVQSFWMKNTYLPLDMIFIDEKLRVVGIVHDAEPLTTTSRSVDEPSRYTLEVNAGFAREHGLAKGQIVAFRGI